MKGDALAEKQVRAGTPAHAIFLANDSFGNARLEGGDNVEIVLKSNDFIDEGLEVDANVEDHADGTYSVRFTLPKSGKWTVHLKCWPDKGEKPEQSVRMSFNSFVTGDAGTKSQDVSNTGVIECLRGKVNALTLKCLESKPMFFVGAETAWQEPNLHELLGELSAHLLHHLQRVSRDKVFEAPRTLGALAAGAFSGVAQAFLSTPMDWVKIQAQVHGGSSAA